MNVTLTEVVSEDFLVCEKGSGHEVLCMDEGLTRDERDRATSNRTRSPKRSLSSDIRG